MQPGEPLFFKLKAPHNAIAGFGYLAHFSTLPVSMAWQVYDRGNGALTFGEMRVRLIRIRTRFDMPTDPKQDFRIGCILVDSPVFFAEQDWIRVPSDWSGNIVQGKGYDLTAGEGQRIWLECLARSSPLPATRIAAAAGDAALGGEFGAPSVIRPRLGQRSFRVAVLDSLCV